MNFGPQKFFIGLMDFSIPAAAHAAHLFISELVPGCAGHQCGETRFRATLGRPFFASYVSGHLINLFGFWLDEFYDLIRRYTLNKQNHHDATSWKENNSVSNRIHDVVEIPTSKTKLNRNSKE
jgi:hypothetical protein